MCFNPTVDETIRFSPTVARARAVELASHPRPTASRSFPSRSLARALARLLSASRAPRSLDSDSAPATPTDTRTTAAAASPSPSSFANDDDAVDASLCMSFNRTLIGVDGDTVAIVARVSPSPSRVHRAPRSPVRRARRRLRRRRSSANRRPTRWGDSVLSRDWCNGLYTRESPVVTRKESLDALQ